MNIDLHIERLVLDGLPIAHSQGALVKAAVEAELGRLLREGGMNPALESGCAFPSMPGNAITLVRESNPSVIGRQIATAVYCRIGKGK